MMKAKNNIKKYFSFIFSFFLLSHVYMSGQENKSAIDLDSVTIYGYKELPKASHRVTTDTFRAEEDSSVPKKIIIPIDPAFREKMLRDLRKEGYVLTPSSMLTPYPSPPLKTNNAISVGIGSANMYDTYLSPLKYKGFSARLNYEQMRETTWFNYRFYKQQVFDLEFAKGDNPAKNATEYWLLANYRIGGHYRVLESDRFRLGVGGLWDVNLGVLYNERNGNNPATARAYTNLNLSAIASYKFDWFAVRWQLDTPVIGALFSMKYGLSYYELSLGNTINVVNFASLHNQRALRNYLTVDVPINKYTIRVGYLGSYYQTKVRNVQTHHYTNSFVIGFPIEGVKKPRAKAENNYWD